MLGMWPMRPEPALRSNRSQLPKVGRAKHGPSNASAIPLPACRRAVHASPACRRQHSPLGPCLAHPTRRPRFPPPLPAPCPPPPKKKQRPCLARPTSAPAPGPCLARPAWKIPAMALVAMINLLSVKPRKSPSGIGCGATTA